ncbi:hypothetical protein BC938DRAFT_478100 [Jimgerdemannia flammicorona]|uniref:Septin-type G domain-containing protein n=1 Tax=Jimgerdemannia flammicorona TaxID=994334 RepID=A0A433QND5_9FUNG|nr:hypothetical protein BC938DRAFT_478100 [Jimgerdemannia flammicorona]
MPLDDSDCSTQPTTPQTTSHQQLNTLKSTPSSRVSNAGPATTTTPTKSSWTTTVAATREEIFVTSRSPFAGGIGGEMPRTGWEDLETTAGERPRRSGGDCDNRPSGDGSFVPLDHDDLKNPFVERAQNIQTVPLSASQVGPLRILITGDSGVGKTMLVRRFLCSIEHTFGTKSLCYRADCNSWYTVDTHPVPSGPPSPPRNLTQYAASTARISLWPSKAPTTGGEATPESPQTSPSPFPERAPVYNVHMYDTSGYGITVNGLPTVKRITAFLRNTFVHTRAIFADAIPLVLLHRYLEPPSPAHDLIDVILYVILERVKSADIDYIKELGQFSSVIPCVVLPTYPRVEIEDVRTRVRNEFERLGVRWTRRSGMVCANGTALGDGDGDPTLPFVIHQVQGDGNGNGDEDEFAALCNLLMRPERLDVLRHMNVARFVKWVDEQKRAQVAPVVDGNAQLLKPGDEVALHAKIGRGLRVRMLGDGAFAVLALIGLLTGLGGYLVMVWYLFEKGLETVL